jgi:hypothetical protein
MKKLIWFAFCKEKLNLVPGTGASIVHSFTMDQKGQRKAHFQRETRRKTGSKLAIFNEIRSKVSVSEHTLPVSIYLYKNACNPHS